MSDINDLEIVDRVLAGDNEAFSGIIQDYQNRIFRYVYSKVYDYDEALDMTQEIFVMTMESLKSFRRESKFSTWLYSIMVNYCKNYRKKRERYAVIPITRGDGAEEFELQIPDDREDPARDIIDGDSLRIVKEELFNLPDDYREILILRDIEGLSYNDIVRVLGINLSSVKVRIHRGRAMLKKRLAERGFV